MVSASQCEGAEDLVGKARYIATQAHHGQFDKAGNPYIGHPARVVAAVDGHYAEVVAWLHDVVEDTPVTLDQLRETFPEIVVAAVDAVTKRADATKVDYYARIRANPIALEVKLADIADNSDPQRLALVDSATRKRLSEKYAFARSSLLTG